MPLAIVIDGAYFLRRFPYSFPDLDPKSPSDICLGVSQLAFYYTSLRDNPFPTVHVFETNHLYRILFYDCPPLEKRLHYPVSGKIYDLKNTENAILRREIHKSLNRLRKVALRLGRLNENFSGWRPKPDSVKRWLEQPSLFKPCDDDFEVDVVQKGVDMRLGLDIAAMSFKKQVDQIVLVAGDADFVPVAKLARREGIDVILEPMWGHAPKDLLDNVDGVKNFKLKGRPHLSDEQEV